MSFKKISTLSIISFIILTQHNHVVAMENTEQPIDVIIQPIRDKLDKLNLSILDFSRHVQLAREQKNKDKEIYKNYITQGIGRISMSLYENFNHGADEICTYKGRICYGPHSTFHLPGSKGKYKFLEKKLSEREVIFIQFAANMQRGKDYANIDLQKATDYLNDVNARLQEILDAIAKEEQK